MADTPEKPTVDLFETRDPSQPTRFGRFWVPDSTWLETAEPEPVLEPELAIVDTHHHMWDLPGFRYLFDEVLADVSTGHRVVATVFNDSHAMYPAEGPDHLRPVGEVEFVAGVAAMSESGIYGPTRVGRGIVSTADLTLGDAVGEVLDAQVAAGGGRFKGIRYGAGWDPDPAVGNAPGMTGRGFYGLAPVQAGVGQLAARGLSFDAWVLFTQLQEVVDLARAVPEASIVLCHAGAPLGYGPYAGRRDEVFELWSAGMTALASCPNVTVKLGGMMMRLAAFDYGRAAAPVTSERLAELWAPYLTRVVELFGADRCMVESNFPVEKMGIGSRALWNTFKRIFASASAHEKALLFSGTADRVYRLGI